AGIYVWLFVRRASLRNCISALRLARIVCGRHAASAIGYLHSCQGSRVASLAAPNINHHLLKQNKIGYDGQEFLDEPWQHPQAALAAVHLRHFADDSV